MSLKVDAVVLVENFQCRGCVGPNCGAFTIGGHHEGCSHKVASHWAWQKLKVCKACWNSNAKPDGDFYAPKVPIVTIRGSAASAFAPPPGLTEEPKLSLQMDMVEAIKQLRPINERLDILGGRMTRIEGFFDQVRIVANGSHMSDDECSETSWKDGSKPFCQ